MKTLATHTCKVFTITCLFLLHRVILKALILEVVLIQTVNFCRTPKVIDGVAIMRHFTRQLTADGKNTLTTCLRYQN